MSVQLSESLLMLISKFLMGLLALIDLTLQGCVDLARELLESILDSCESVDCGITLTIEHIHGPVSQIHTMAWHS